jgi:hypothetical protein
MKTTENNKLLAEFMGIKYVYDDKYIENIKEMRTNGVMFEQGYMLSELKYNTDWNWLMEVVEKIESLGVVVEIKENVCYISPFPNNYIPELEKTKIEATYNACLSFVKWYNLNK